MLLIMLIEEPMKAASIAQLWPAVEAQNGLVLHTRDPSLVSERVLQY